MSDFEKFQKENLKRERAAAQARAADERAADAAANADIAADDAYERRYRRVRREDRHAWGHKRTTIPIWRITAGSWAQLLLMAVWYVLFIVLIQALAPPNQELKGLLSVGALLPALIAGPVTWRLMGARAREVIRTGIRFSPVVVFLLAGISVALKSRFGDTQVSHGGPSAPAATATRPAVAPAAPMPPGPLSPEAADDAIAAALAGADPDQQWRALDVIAQRHERTWSEIGSLRRQYADLERFAAATQRITALHTHVGALTSFASAHTDALVQRASSSDGALFALRFAPPDPAVVTLATDRILHGNAKSQRLALDALTALVRRASSGAGPLLKDVTKALLAAPVGATWLAWLNARLGHDLDGACRALGDATMATTEAERKVALDALADLSPRCAAAGPQILKRLTAIAAAAAKTPLSQEQDWAWGHAFKAVSFTGLQNYGVLRAFLGRPEFAAGVPGLTRPGDVLDDLFDEHVIAVTGWSSDLLKRPAAPAGAARPTVTFGPCEATALGIPADALAALNEPRPCVVVIQGASLVITPLGL